MSKEVIVTMVLTVLGSNAVFAFLQFLITRHDTKKNIKGKLVTLEKDVLRTQLLLMVSLWPKEKKEIMTLGQHYFDDLDGNWYMTSLFNKWLLDNDIARPEWFKD